MRRTSTKLSEQIVIGQPAISIKVTESRPERVCLGAVPPSSINDSHPTAPKNDEQSAN